MASGRKCTVSVEPQEKTPAAIVFVTVDTSGSMAGSKIKEVCQGLRAIVDQTPNYVRFTVRKFDENVKTIVSKKKKFLDVDRMLRSLENCGSKTALYDGIGQTINEIPFCYSKLDVIHVLAFTDGCDNISKEYTLQSIIQLLKEKMISGNIHFTFIQAGNRTIVTDALQSSDLPKSKLTVLRVEDTTEGIAMGFRKAQKRMKMCFEVNISSGPNMPNVGRLQISGLTSNGGAVRIQVGSQPSNGYYKNPAAFRGDFKRDQHPKNRNPSALKSEKSPKRTRERQPKSTYANVPSAAALATEKPDNPGPAPKFNFMVWVGNIPKTSTNVDLLDFFRQWGDCLLERVTDMKECKCAVIGYDQELSQTNALKYGHMNTFMDSKLKVLKT